MCRMADQFTQGRSVLVRVRPFAQEHPALHRFNVGGKSQFAARTQETLQDGGEGSQSLGEGWGHAGGPKERASPAGAIGRKLSARVEQTGATVMFHKAECGRSAG